MSKLFRSPDTAATSTAPHIYFERLSFPRSLLAWLRLALFVVWPFRAFTLYPIHEILSLLYFLLRLQSVELQSPISNVWLIVARTDTLSRKVAQGHHKPNASKNTGVFNSRLFCACGDGAAWRSTTNGEQTAIADALVTIVRVALVVSCVRNFHWLACCLAVGCINALARLPVSAWKLNFTFTFKQHDTEVTYIQTFIHIIHTYRHAYAYTRYIISHHIPHLFRVDGWYCVSWP